MFNIRCLLGVYQDPLSGFCQLCTCIPLGLLDSQEEKLTRNLPKKNPTTLEIALRKALIFLVKASFQNEKCLPSPKRPYAQIIRLVHLMLVLSNCLKVAFVTVGLLSVEFESKLEEINLTPSPSFLSFPELLIRRRKPTAEMEKKQYHIHTYIHASMKKMRRAPRAFRRLRAARPKWGVFVGGGLGGGKAEGWSGWWGDEGVEEAKQFYSTTRMQVNYRNGQEKPTSSLCLLDFLLVFHSFSRVPGNCLNSFFVVSFFVFCHNSAPRSRRGARIGGNRSHKPPGAFETLQTLKRLLESHFLHAMFKISKNKLTTIQCSGYKPLRVCHTC